MPKDEILQNFLTERKTDDDRLWLIINKVLLTEARAIEQYIRDHKSEMSIVEISNCLRRQANIIHTVEYLAFDFDDQNCLGDALDMVDSFEYSISRWIQELL